VKVGYKIKDRREALRMSQEDLSAKSGVSRQTISSIENNPEKSVSTKTLEKIASALGTTIGNLFFE
jgi:transcriptional regulator with XRE-family HTH domain